MKVQRLNYIPNPSARTRFAPVSQKDEDGRRAFGKWFELKVSTRETPAARQAEKIACAVVEQHAKGLGLAAKVQAGIKEFVDYVKLSAYNRWYRTYKLRRKWCPNDAKIRTGVEQQLRSKTEFVLKPSLAFKRIQEWIEAFTKSIKQFEIKVPKAAPELALSNAKKY